VKIILSDKEVFYALTHNSSVKGCVTIKLADIGVNKFTETLKLQGKNLKLS